MKILSNILLLSLIIDGALGFDCTSIRKNYGARLSKSSLSLFEGSEKPGRRQRKQFEERQEYERRRSLWLERYGSIEALEKTFGSPPIWGDLSPEQTRRLYHTLLPRSLLALHEMGLMKPEELAPLAYNARIAAKEYARSRCIWTGRLMTAAFDQYRSIRERGRLLGSSSLSWEELWEKYEAQIVEEEMSQDEKRSRRSGNGDEDLTMRIYLRILERSCATNQAFDSLFLKEDEEDSQYLNLVATKLEDDVRYLLLSSNIRVKAEKVEKKLQKAERKEIKKQQKQEKKELKKTQKLQRRQEKRRQREKQKEAILLGSLDPPHETKPWTIRRLLASRK